MFSLTLISKIYISNAKSHCFNMSTNRDLTNPPYVIKKNTLYYKKIGYIYQDELVINLPLCTEETLSAVFYYFNNADLGYTYLFIYMHAPMLTWFFQFTFPKIE